jgi:putative tryptophan/tyrosine transport system substrate-binding protein
MKRREFVTLIGGAAVSWPSAARAQQVERVRRIGVVIMYPENDPQGQLRATAFQSQLEKAGWTIGGNLQVNFEWGTGDADWVRSTTEQALRRTPDVLLANGDAATFAARGLTTAVPIIFIGNSDPVGDGLVRSFSHPGGNITGFTVMEPSLGVKLLGMLKQVAPHITRVAVLLNPDNATHKRIFSLIEAAASNFSVGVVSASAREAARIEATMTRWGQDADYGLIVPADPMTNAQRNLIVELAARYRLPAVYALRAAVADGGLMSYGVDLIGLFRQAAVYADRMLKGEKPADLPVQLPTKYELVINLKTTKTLSLDVPVSLLATADEVIE